MNWYKKKNNTRNNQFLQVNYTPTIVFSVFLTNKSYKTKKNDIVIKKYILNSYCNEIRKHLSITVLI